MSYMQYDCTIYFVRHGESTANRDRIMGGNPSLTDKGRQQAEATRILLADVHFDEAYSSQLRRAIDTVAIIAGHDISLDHQVAAFNERKFGNIEGRPEAEWIAINDTWKEKYLSLPFAERAVYEYAEGVETDKQLCDRFMAGLTEVAANNRGKTVLVVSSAGPLRVMLMHLGFADYLTIGSFDNAGFVELAWRGDSFHIEQTSGVHAS